MVATSITIRKVIRTYINRILLFRSTVDYLNQNEKIEASREFGDLVDEPLAYYFVKTVSTIREKSKKKTLRTINSTWLLSYH